ncbi:hypothetical protein HK096_011403 [Nowakowskiella sp. JEL0078]|nr:hypothetical protein HK096_011403 [Nowakowskiella sp. JEL0078]
MDSDGSFYEDKVVRSAIDKRISPSWAYWYPVEQLPEWLNDNERIDFLEKFPENKNFNLVEVAFDHRKIFSEARNWIKKNKNLIPKPENPLIPLNRGNSALTTDIIVVRYKKDEKKFQIALIVRGAKPFLGIKALPGGFVNYQEQPVSGAIRELQEETHLNGLEKDAYLLEYRGSPDRDPRQHTITCVYILKSTAGKILGGDDAADAAWFDLDEVFKWPDIAVEDLDPTKISLDQRHLSFDHAIILRNFKNWWKKEGKKKRMYIEV